MPKFTRQDLLTIVVLPFVAAVLFETAPIVINLFQSNPTLEGVDWAGFALALKAAAVGGVTRYLATRIPELLARFRTIQVN